MPKQQTNTPLDIHIGKRLRARRHTKGYSMQHLAALSDISYQQIQKYERGTNRISASRLYQFACLLDIEPGWFFEGIETCAVPGKRAPDPPNDWLRLWCLIAPLPDDVRHAYLAFGKSLASAVPGTPRHNSL